ncbi:MAG: OmpA family protein [Gemmatimonadales bacterium]
MFRVALRFLAIPALLLGAAACHPKPPAVAPAPTPNADSIAAANARRDALARADAARRDSTARADAARRDAAARAEAMRRAEAEAAAARATIGAKIFFDYDQDSLRADAVAVLDRKVPLLQARPDIRIRIEGNADERGSDEYNVVLSQRRSAAARRYLVARGIAEGRIEVVSFGEERPVCQEHAEPCWQQNRRDEFVITSGTLVSTTTPRHD